MRKIILPFSLLFLTSSFVQKDPCYWQQKVDYTMDIDMNVKTYQYNGKQKLVYTNNSPDSLSTVYYHLFFNAFQPGSEMDIRLQNIADPDMRMVNNLGTKNEPKYQSRISVLKPKEIGYIKVNSLIQDGNDTDYKVEGTILEVNLAKPIACGESTVLEMDFKAQVPLQIRRSGRNNAEGVALSMTQWYPKLAEYDKEGWHTDPYIGREFYGVWGDFDVTIHIDKKYTIGGTGYLQNPDEIGHGYQDKQIRVKKNKENKLSWHFKAPNVHDFAWAADKNFIHDIFKIPQGPDLHFFYKDKKEIKEVWKKLPEKVSQMMSFYQNEIGPYPYKQYSVIQGGDGGMEYAMCTLITGERSEESLVGVTAHELAHSWFQLVLANNETRFPWFDEGFTTYISDLCIDAIYEKNQKNPFKGSYDNYYSYVKSGYQEPMSTHSDHFKTNFAYNVSSYSMGSIFVSQLESIIGEKNLSKTLKSFYKIYKFKHPEPRDFIRIAEKVSGINLKWYYNEWIQTTHHIDYQISNVKDKTIYLKRVGHMPMPVDLRVTYIDGTTQYFTIPLRMMRGHKPTTNTVLPSWAWAIPNYSFQVEKLVKKVEIDPQDRIADINASTLIYPR